MDGRRCLCPRGYGRSPVFKAARRGAARRDRKAATSNEVANILTRLERKERKGQALWKRVNTVTLYVTCCGRELSVRIGWAAS